MKSILKKLIILSYNSFFYLFKRNISFRKTNFFLVKYKSGKANSTCLNNSKIEKTQIILNGHDNSIEVNNSLILKSSIYITGSNNKLLINSEVKLREAIIHIRGNGCVIKIGSGTTFGSIRIVNVGENNTINIGQNCLFADSIELWASDTHSIYDNKGILLNPELPVTIGNDVWVGSHVKILKGITIGDGAIIGMNALVSKDIKSKTLNVGNPTRCIREDINWSSKYENKSNQQSFT
ncbi:MAG: acyltransferase [Prolixibacteraceae bacterium]|nr:acyltransferase [Prolixibacteraceae bacterium]